MDVFLMIRRKKTTIFIDAKESTTVGELKKVVEGILKTPPEDQKLFKDDEPLDDNKALGDCGFTSSTARAQAPATIGLAFKEEDGDTVEITPLSTPPELPDVMKPQEPAASHSAESAAS
ncbi:elongin-B [Lingula anatina]|uniref:Elongin-B n=1 Tax=Lingula anatina TaxID=7574 RepID=A0A1S3KHN8_LINAN|nr:elongin-B [Lingula anatina]|eukprot:XP_013422017.1 elongin-B [Lingula anatina]